MAPLMLSCHQCSQRFQVSPQSRGRRVKCPACATAITVPGPSGSKGAAAGRLDLRRYVGKDRSAEPTAPSLRPPTERPPQPAAADPLGRAPQLQPTLAPNYLAQPTYASKGQPNGTLWLVLAVGGGALGFVFLMIIGAAVVAVYLSSSSAPKLSPPTDVSRAADTARASKAANGSSSLADGGRFPGSYSTGSAAEQAADSLPPPPVVSAPSDPVELARLTVGALEEKIALISRVDDIASAKAVAEQFGQVDRRHRYLSEKGSRQLKTAAQEREIESLHGSQLKDLERQWHEHWMRVGEIPGALEYMHPELAEYADLDPIPDDAAGLQLEAVRLMAIMLEQLGKVHDLRSALAASPRYRAAAVRYGIARARMRSALGLGINDGDPSVLHAMHRQLDQERTRINSIAGAGYAFTNGEQRPSYSGEATPATRVASESQRIREVEEIVPPEFQSFFAQNGQAVLIIPRGLRDPKDEQQISRLLSVRNPSIRAGLGRDGRFAVAPVADLDALLTTIDFAQVAVDRENRIVVLDIRYPLPSASKAAIEALQTAIASGDYPAIRNACLRITNMEPDENRAQVGRYMLDLIPYEPVRGTAIAVIQKGWISQEQAPQARRIIAQLDDRGHATALAIGLSQIANLDDESTEFLASFLEVSPFHAIEILRNVGPDAEPFVHPYLKHPRSDVRKEACQVLSHIGTERSLPALEQVLNDPDRGVVDKANHAIREINGR